MAGGKIIGGPFSNEVIQQLSIRSKILAKNTRTDQDIMLLTGKTGWVKLTSGVNVDGSSKLAEEYVLIGGQKGKTGTNTYSNYFGEAGKGFRPMPGITSVQIRSINRFGTLKEATITFNCWDRGQLTDIEKLFMRPGFTALLEWGHSMYTKNGIEPYDKHVETVQTFFTPGKSKEQIYAEIERLKVGSAHNYDGILGFIKNFSWSFRPDGGYDCTTTVISIGEIMESLTIDVDTPSITDRNPTEGEEGIIIPATMLQDVLVNIKNSNSITTIWSDIVAKFSKFATKHTKVGGREGLDVGRMFISSIKSGDKIDETSTEYFTYISLRSFCELVNTLIIVDNNDKNVVKLNTDVRALGDNSSTIPTSRFRSYKFHTSSDPNVCILITDTTKNWSYDETLLQALQKIKVGSTNEILNIYVNLNFLQKQVAALFAQPKESRTLLNLFQPILVELNTVLGNINNFGLHYEESKFTYYIVDRKVETKSDEVSVLNITGLKSAVSKFDFTTKLSPALTTMIAISAQAGGADVGVEADALLRWNEGLSDRIMRKKTVQTSEAASNTAQDKQDTEKQQDERRTAINKALSTIYNDRQYDREAIGVARTQNIQFAAEYVQNHQPADNNAGPAGIIPFEVGIEMEGISGIKIGQAFKISTGIMPAKYDGVVGFIVTGVDHTISGNRWVTNLKAQTIILKGGGKSKDKDYKDKDPVGEGLTPVVIPQKKAISTAISFLKGKGFSDEATAALVGGWLAESQLNPAIVNISSKYTYNSKFQTYAAGIVQWVGPRRVAMLKYAKSKGLQIAKYNEAVSVANNATKTKQSGNDITAAFATIDLTTQLEFAVIEMLTDPYYKSLGSAGFKTTKDIKFAKQWAYEKYEGGNYTPGAAYGKRGANATTLLNKIKNGDYV